LSKQIKNQYISVRINVSGLVQGVGFRPFIYRIAHEFQIKGWVENNLKGVLIHAEGENEKINLFVEAVKDRAPSASVIESIGITEAATEKYASFFIKKSSDFIEGVTEVSPDIAVCEECLKDLENHPHRIDYPFINCTNCGPRFTIIKDLPYDRHQTTMEPFRMCEVCRKEYENILDRRFHAQPVACLHCGPEYLLVFKGTEYREIRQILNKTAELVNSGKIIAIKGLGGYHLMCDACNEDAVKTLRNRKLRENKPFAVMIRDLETAKKTALVDEVESDLLTSWRRPIVLLRLKQGDAEKPVSPPVMNGFNTIGIMLPYMPLHYQLFSLLSTDAVVLTSGNISDEPVCISDTGAIDQLSGIADAILSYNREIYNRADDSVVMVSNKKPRLIRRSKGYAPTTIGTGLNLDGIFAAGAELTNCFALGKLNRAVVSQHIGDLKNMETLDFYEESIRRFSHLFRIKPAIAVCDLHPDYLSTQYALNLNLPVVKVQHHHAHIASVMAEHRIDEKVIGVALDGVGLGTDGNIWGGEFLICDLMDFERYTHFEYIPAPGGDQVTREPWRMAFSYVYSFFGKEFIVNNLPILFPDLKMDLALKLLEMTDKKVNCPLTSSAGRLFDAVSALTGICRWSGFHAEAPMRLEAMIDQREHDFYPIQINKTISFKPTFERLFEDIRQQKGAATISARFHNTMVWLIGHICEIIRDERHLNKVALSGGSFQNKYLLEKTEQLLESKGFETYSPLQLPANDGGIAVGQLAVAAKRRNS